MLGGIWNQTDEVYKMNVNNFEWSKHTQKLLKARAWHKVQK